MEDVDGFDWDQSNRTKCRKHGVSIREIEAMLSGAPAVAPDLKHSDHEDRYIAVGRDSRNRPMFVAFAYRLIDGKRLVRPVSARYMHKKEADPYEAKSP